jgi:hypothetical protein
LALTIAAVGAGGVAPGSAEAAPAKPKTATVQETIPAGGFDTTAVYLVFRATANRTGPYLHQAKPPKGAAKNHAGKKGKWWIKGKLLSSVKMVVIESCPDGTEGGRGEETIEQWTGTNENPIFVWGRGDEPKKALKSGPKREIRELEQVPTGGKWWYDAALDKTYAEARENVTCPPSEDSNVVANVRFSPSAREQLIAMSSSAAHQRQLGYTPPR